MRILPEQSPPRRFILGRALSIARKEIRHLSRDLFTLGMALGVPVFLVIFFGYVLDYDVKRVKLLVVDQDQTRLSGNWWTFLRARTISPRWRSGPEKRPSAPWKKAVPRRCFLLNRGSPATSKGPSSTAQIVIDGSDNQTTSVIASYLAGLQPAAIRRLLPETRASPGTLRTRFLFNPELNSRWFVVTGLFVVVTGIVSVLLTALTVAREWETGSMELLLSTPVQPLEIIVGKLAPYMGLCLAAVGLIYAAARVGFGIPFNGNHGTFLLACFLFLTCTLAQGLLISVLTRQQQLAMQFSNLTGFCRRPSCPGSCFPWKACPCSFAISPRYCRPDGSWWRAGGYF
jgi:ABC-2 type transport system permease protein